MFGLTGCALLIVKYLYFGKQHVDGIKWKLNALFEKMQENSEQPRSTNAFKITLLEGMREFILQKIIKSKHCLPWVTLNIRKLMCSKRRLHTQLKKRNARRFSINTKT